MKEIQIENYTCIYPDAHDGMSDEEFEKFREGTAFTCSITAFPSGSIAMLGTTFAVERAKRWHYALGRAIELAGGW